MRDLSLHILDLIENSLRAGASVVRLGIIRDTERDVLKIVIEDNGEGLSVPADLATDPFYTTKSGKRVGLGLSLFKAAAERAGGKLNLGKSELGGLAVVATMQLTHVDRSPLGNIPETISAVVCANPNLEIRCEVRGDGCAEVVSVSDVARKEPEAAREPILLANRVAGILQSALESCGMIG